MSRPQDLLLRRICAKNDTYTKAQVLLHSASMKTGPGTGYDLGQGAPGLSAICAFIASQELGNSDVSEKVAQTASCLAPKIFKTTLNTVRVALSSSSSQTVDNSDSLQYHTLIAEHRLGRKVFVQGCMKDVERSLVASGMLPAEFLPPSEIVRVSIFCWACDKLLKVKKVHADELLTKYGLHKRDYQDVIEILESACQDVAARVRQKVAELSTKVTAASKASKTSPTKATLESPSKPPTKSLLKALPPLGEVDIDASPTKTPTHKRKVAFAAPEDDDEDVPETPSKRPRVTSPIKAAPQLLTDGQPTTAPLRTRSARTSIFPSTKASSAQSTLEQLRNAANARERSMQTGQVAVVDPISSSTNAMAPISAPDLAPSTPRKLAPKGASPRKDAQTLMRSGNRSQQRVSHVLSPHGDSESARPRRFRPIFTDHAQWNQRDPKVEREWKAVDALKRHLASKYAGGITQPRPVGVVST